MSHISRRTLLRAIPALGAATLLLRRTTPTQATGTRVPAMDIRVLPPTETLKRALDVGKLNVALMPDEWANYGGLIEAFTQKYALPVNRIDVKGNANAVLTALRASPKTKTDAPDVIDVPLANGIQAKLDGLLSPYLPASWAKIPAFLKDRQGYWAGSHFGVLTFEFNSEMVSNPPRNWSDLLKPEYKGRFALAGDPRKLPLAANTIYSAALAANESRGRRARRIATGGDGLNFFNQLQQAGTLLPTFATPATVDSGKTPITFRWDYQALHDRDQTANKIRAVIPERGVLARFFVQGINALSPNPYGARLWLDFLHSDEGQLQLLKGYARSTWFGDLVRRGVIPREQMEKLLPAQDYVRMTFPGVKQAAAALKTIAEGWNSVVGLNF